MTSTTVAHQNRELALRGFAEYAAGNVEALRALLREDFVEHSPGKPSGRDAFIDFLAAAAANGAAIDLKRVIADGEYVVMHHHLTTPGDRRGVAVVDIWRFAGGRIAEHWDVVQPVADPPEIPHGMF
jgi:predicted SnoaL-like aldol condensation-catalyzing enzyme